MISQFDLFFWEFFNQLSRPVRWFGDHRSFRDEPPLLRGGLRRVFRSSYRLLEPSAPTASVEGLLLIGESYRA